MATLGKHCRAYQLSRLRQFLGWTEKPENARIERIEVDRDIVEAPRTLTGEDYVYLQNNFTVTDGIFIDENVIFDAVSPEWIAFCRDVLGYKPVTQ
jgi:hypothetical protein